MPCPRHSLQLVLYDVDLVKGHPNTLKRLEVRAERTTLQLISSVGGDAQLYAPCAKFPRCCAVLAVKMLKMITVCSNFQKKKKTLSARDSLWEVTLIKATSAVYSPASCRVHQLRGVELELVRQVNCDCCLSLRLTTPSHLYLEGWPALLTAVACPGRLAVIEAAA
ncbi:hypothetical protein RRG08_055054 [Elysia crispata]|uniref:Uncharacterized protein n=1 Tax=Elysia crispata TaxID=231223 RepID=A0AAE1AZX3_9GAST|nr:hypothetical protein RRG08_055054 [Elysia crispata]